jgi:spermidine synthase
MSDRDARQGQAERLASRARAERATRVRSLAGSSSRLAVLLLTALTGFSGLVYEVTWEKVLATLLGSHSEATAAVLGLFLGGLALGYALLGSFTRARVARARARGRPAYVLLAYGCVEASIGLWALAFPALFRAAQAASLAVPGGAAAGFAFDVALSACLVLPPALLMGGTIPMLTQALSRSLADATRLHALVYASNTFGAFAGALAAGYWLLPVLGLVGALRAMAIVNLAAGAALAALGWRGEAAHAEPEAPRAPLLGLAAFAAVALLSGFAMMTLQTVLIRLGALAFGASQFTFSLVVSVFVLSIALGSFAVSALRRIPDWLLLANLWTLVALLALLYVGLGDATYWAHRLRTLFPAQDEAAFASFQLATFAALLAMLALPVAASGATLPLIFHRLRREQGDLGHAAGMLYGWNTAGSLLGALLGGYALLSWLDLHAIYRLALAALAAAAALAMLRVLGRRARSAAGASVAAAWALFALLPAWSGERLSAGLFRERSPTAQTRLSPDAFFAARSGVSLLFYEDDPSASIAAKQWRLPGGGIERSIVTNGKPDAAVVGDRVTMALAGIVPALLAREPRRAFVVGYGTGMSAGALASLDSIESVEVAEISPAILRAAPLFDFANGAASRNPKLRIVRGDAYRMLSRSEERFDVIVSVPSNPWVGGIEMLYSVEFLSAAREHLTAGGVHAQWFHVYETNAQSIATVLRNYAAVFEHVAVWYGRGADLILLGLRDPESALDLRRIGARVAQPDFARALSRLGISSLPALLAHELLPQGVVHATALPGELHTLLHPRLGYSAARGFFAGRQGRLPITATRDAAIAGQRGSLVARLGAQRGGALSAADREALVSETCRWRPVECTTLLAAWRHEAPAAPELAGLLQRVAMLPEEGAPPDAALVAPIAELFGNAATRSVAPLEALEATELFAQYYHHSAPFSRTALAALFERCAEDAKRRVACRRGLALAEELLGPLRSERAAEQG